MFASTFMKHFLPLVFVWLGKLTIDYVSDEVTVIFTLIFEDPFRGPWKQESRDIQCHLFGWSQYPITASFMPVIGQRLIKQNSNHFPGNRNVTSSRSRSVERAQKREKNVSSRSMLRIREIISRNGEEQATCFMAAVAVLLLNAIRLPGIVPRDIRVTFCLRYKLEFFHGGE